MTKLEDLYIRIIEIHQPNFENHVILLSRTMRKVALCFLSHTAGWALDCNNLNILAFH